MNKQQYMDELVSKLGVFGEDIKNEIVSDYEEHFRMGLSNGKSEEQICNELGSIDELVDELNKLTGKQNEAAKPAEDKAQAFAKDSAENGGNSEKKLNDEEIKKALEDASEQFTKGLGDAMTSLAGFLGNMAATIAKNSEKWTAEFSEKAGSWGSEFKTKAGNAADTIKEKAGNAADKLKEKADEFKENRDADEAGRSFKAKTSDVADTIREKAEEFTETVKEKVHEVAEGFEEKETVGESFCDKAAEEGKDFTEKSESFRSKAGEKVSDFADKSTEFAKKAAGEIGAFAKDFAAKSKAFVKEISDNYHKNMNKEAGEAAAEADFEDDLEDFLGEEEQTLRELDSLDGDIDSLDEDESIAATNGMSADTADSVIIETDCAHVSVQSSDSDKVKFNYENNGTVNQRLAYGFDFRQEGKTIYAIAKKKPGTTNFFKSLTCPDIELTIEVPENLKNLSIRSMSGEISCEDVSVEQLTISTMSGELDMENCIFRALDASTMSGDISLADVSASEMKMTTVSGDIEITNGRAENITFKTTSGDVTVEDVKAASITASSVSGDIDLSLDEVGGYLAHAKTTCGDITLEFDNELMEVTRGGSYVLGTGEAKLNLTTVSGDIQVEA